MKELVNAINKNYDLYDFLHKKYISYDTYRGSKVNSYYAPLEFDSEYVKLFKDNIDWKKISISAPLTEDEIELYFEELRECMIMVQYGPAVECLFSSNPYIKWNNSIIEKYKRHLHWPSICENPSIPWNEELIDKYLIQRYNTTSNWIALSSNKGIKWNEYLISKYYSLLFLNCIIKNSEIFWSKSLLNCTLELIPEEDKKLYLTYFSEINNIEWDLNTILDYPVSYSYWVRNVIKNGTISFSIKDIRINIDRISKELFQIIQTSQELEWDKDLIYEFSEKIDFKILSDSNNVNWSPELIEIFKDKLDFKTLSSNTSESITEYLLKTHQDKWDFILLSSNINVEWTEQLIDDFIDLVDLNVILELNKIDFKSDFIEKHKSKISWVGKWKKFGSDGEYYDASTISTLYNIPISVETLKNVATKWRKGCSLDAVGDGYKERDIGEWHHFSLNMHLTERHLDSFQDCLSWNILSSNKNIKIDNETILKYSERWDYSELLKRDDIIWSVETFFKISKYLNWDLLNMYDFRIMEILRPAENVIMNHFTFGNISSVPLHSENWSTSFCDKEYKELHFQFTEKICSDALSEISRLEDLNSSWHWLRKFQPLFYEHSRLLENLEREPKFYMSRVGEAIRKFINEYKRVKKRFMIYYEERNSKA